jgi:hypothetical protein
MAYKDRISIVLNVIENNWANFGSLDIAEYHKTLLSSIDCNNLSIADKETISDFEAYYNIN